MSQRDMASFGNRFSTGRATAGSTYTTINENVQVLGSFSTSSGINNYGNLSVTGSTSLADAGMTSLNVNNGKTTIDSNGNILSLGSLSLAGVATMNGIYSVGNLGVGGTSNLADVNMTSANISSGKLTVDSSGNISSLGNVSVGGISTVSSLSVGGSLGVVGTTSLSSLNLGTGKTTIDTNGNITSLGNLSIAGVSTTGSLYSTSVYLNNLTANNGKFSIDTNGNILTTGNVTATHGSFSSLQSSGIITGNINADGTSTLGVLSVTGASSVGGNLSVTGTSTLSGALTANNSLLVGGPASFLGSTNIQSMLGVTDSATFGNSLDVQSGKFLVDASGNSTFGGTLGVTGASTFGGTLGVTGASTFGNSVNVQSGKFVIDSTGNVGFGSTPSGAVVDIYNNSSRIRMRGTGTGLEWNNTGSSVLSSVIYDTDGKVKMYSSSATNPKMSLDSNTISIIGDPTSATLTTTKHTAITPVGILTVSGLYTVSVSQTGTTATLSGTDASALTAYVASNKCYLYVDDPNYRTKILFPTISGSNVTFVDILTGSAVSGTVSAENKKVYVATAVVTNSGDYLSANLVTAGNPQVVVANQYGKLGLSA